ncbi:MAG: acylphosphatase [Oscillospiraceae bacterium]|nr:acylphosphatase [Oscillospiraceae bacterium]
MERLRIRFYGDVQGVGFRYRAYHSANSLGLTGWVKNCPDGTVLCEVQGERTDIDKMVEMIDSGRYVNITNMEIKKLELSESDRDFVIGD